MVMQSTQLLLLSCSVSALLPILGWVGHVDLSWGTFYYAPLILLPQHLALYFRIVYLKHSPGPLDIIVLHLLLVTYILGTLFTTSRTILGLARGECSAGTAACLLMARLWIVLIMQSIASVGECTMLGMLVWRARYGGITSDGEHGAVYLPADSANAENGSGRAWAAPSGMPTSINDVQVSFTVCNSCMWRLRRIRSCPIPSSNKTGGVHRGAQVANLSWSVNYQRLSLLS
jgi:hypothetical protein